MTDVIEVMVDNACAQGWGRGHQGGHKEVQGHGWVVIFVVAGRCVYYLSVHHLANPRA